MIKRRRVYTDMKEVEVFIGPCSKFITGQGWVTEVPIEQLKAKGYTKNDSLTKEVERLTEERDMYADDLYWKAEVRKREDFITELTVENAELQKQVDELTDKLGKVLLGIKTDEVLVAKGVEKAIKDTAKEILQKIMNIIKKSNGFLAEEVIRIMAKQNGVEVE